MTALPIEIKYHQEISYCLDKSLTKVETVL